MQVNLSWSAVPNVLFYNIYRGTSTGGPYYPVAQSNPNPGQNPASTQVMTTYIDGPGNLVNGQSYFYVVTSVTLDGESAYSTEIAALAPPYPAAPVPNAAVIT